MKKKGNVCCFRSDRDADLLRAFRTQVTLSASFDIDELSRRVSMMPGSRFYVSEERAVAVVSAMLRGIDVTSKMLPSKRRMFAEIFRRVSALLSVRPGASIVSLVSEVIYSEAPEFYMSPRSVRDRLSAL